MDAEKLQETIRERQDTAGDALPPGTPWEEAPSPWGEPAPPLWQEDPPADPAPPAPAKREDGAWGGVLMQSILAMVVAIGFLVCRLLAPGAAASALDLVQRTAAHDFSFGGRLTELVGDAVTTLNGLMPLDASSNSSESQPEEDAGGDAPSSAPANLPEGQTLVFDDPADTASGQGGIFLPSEDWVVPENATFAPVVFTGNLTFPLKTGWRQTSAFGFRDSPIYGKPEFHTAVDLAAAQGSNILAVFDGTVVESGVSPSLGNYIRIDHGDGFFSTYGHCDRLIAEAGTRVRAGEVIAKVGSTGDSTGYHLHLALKKDGVSFDPAWVFPDQLWSLWNEPDA